MKRRKKGMCISGKALVISKAKNNINKISGGIYTKRRGYCSSVSDYENCVSIS
jgi:hypothetical protein